MSRVIMLIPINTDAGLTSISLGIIHALEQKNISLSVFKPISQSRYSDDAPDLITRILRANSKIPFIEPLTMSHAKSLLSSDQRDVLMEEITARYYAYTQNTAVMLIEGLIPTHKHAFATVLNYEIARMLNAEIIFVVSLGINSLDQLKECINLACSSFGGNKNKNIIGVIVNKLNAPLDQNGYIHLNLFNIFNDTSNTDIDSIELNLLLKNSPLPLLGCIPWNYDLIATRVIDIAYYLDAIIIHKGEISTRRVKFIVFCVCNLPNVLDYICPGVLLVTSADRYDVIVAACLAAMNGVKISAILLINGHNIDHRLQQLCENAFKTGLPILAVRTNICQTSLILQNFSMEISVDDYIRIKNIQKYIANYINNSWIESLSINHERPVRLSPPVFKYQLTELARQAGKCIILPEGEEPRTIKAALICVKRGIAKCVLLGNPDRIKREAAAHGLTFTLNNDIIIINPEVVRTKYVTRLLELRMSKGMTEVMACKQLEDNVVLGTLMLEQDEVDGLVSGAVHTTANTIRPSLQLIKTASGNSLVSSVFFMLLPEQVLVYGDCAINMNPTSEQLAEIAIQSADSAVAFGIEPRVAMISYSTGNSGVGSDVDKVRKATYLAQERRPNLVIDGPLQYDAAIMADIALLKAPNSPVGGRATVFIFPDLNTGNTTYKAVQRSANLLSIGPILQGMRKPVNDLSRGALVEDIIYTIAITAIQAKQIDG